MSWFFLQPMYDGNAYPETWVPLTRHKRAKTTTIWPQRRAKLHSGQGHPGPRDLRFFCGNLFFWTRHGHPVRSREAEALFALRNYPTRNPWRCSAISLAFHRMNHQRRPTVAEDRVVVAAQSHVWRYHRGVRHPVRSHHQREIRYIPRRRAAMVVASSRSHEVRPRRLEIRPLTFCELVNMN